MTVLHAKYIHPPPRGLSEGAETGEGQGSGGTHDEIYLYLAVQCGFHSYLLT